MKLVDDNFKPEDTEVTLKNAIMDVLETLGVSDSKDVKYLLVLDFGEEMSLACNERDPARLHLLASLTQQNTLMIAAAAAGE